MMPKSTQITDRINSLFDKCEWGKARKLLKSEIALDPNNHWLLDRLSVTYYEKQEYADALEAIESAYRLMPSCPLVLWDYAGTLQAVGKYEEAIRFYDQILKEYMKRRQGNCEFDDCWESREWAIGLSLDCFFRLGNCYHGLKKEVLALSVLELYCNLVESNPDIFTLYSVEEAKTLIKQINKVNKNEISEGKKMKRKAKEIFTHC